jgi:alkylation response protein AidB-like acyl-CoA dehydrogenase
MYDLQLTEEQLGIRNAVREFARREVKPAAIRPQRLEPFEKPLLHELMREASGMGLRALMLSEGLGGAGADLLTTCIVMEELAAGDIDIATTLGETSLLAGMLFEGAMTDEIRARFLADFLNDDTYHIALACQDPENFYATSYHRPVGGNNVQPVATAIEQANNEWVLNGKFSFVINAPIAKLIAVEVLATDLAGVSSVHTALVPVGTEGLVTSPRPSLSDATEVGDQPTIAWHHGVGGEVILKNCRIQAHCMLSDNGKPALAAVYTQRASVLCSAMNVGVGQAAYEAALEYTRLRRQGGRNIIEHEAIGTLLGDMAIKLDVSRAVVWRAAWLLDHADNVTDRSQASLPSHHVSRVLSAEMIQSVTESAAECFGAMGVMRDMPLQKYVHDSLVILNSRISCGAARLLIAESVAGYDRAGRK